MITLCIVRHGETDWNKENIFQGREDVELNENGEEQAKKCGFYLKRNKWDMIITSPLKRAIKTAEIIGKVIGLETKEVMDELIERDYGVASGKFKDEIKHKYPDGNIPNAETEKQIRNRCISVLKQLEIYNSKRIIIVTHAWVIGGFIRLLQPDIEIKEIPNGYIKTIVYEKNKWLIEN